MTLLQHNIIVVYMIPDFVDIGGIWMVLPPGIHDATLDELGAKLTYNDIRTELFRGFCAGCELLRHAGCKVAYLDGSFVTDKPAPGDFDACWDPVGVNDTLLDPIFLDFSDGRRRQKERFGGEFFPSSANANGIAPFVVFFQHDRHQSKNKGIIRVRLQ